jgi:hypothetical protein
VYEDFKGNLMKNLKDFMEDVPTNAVAGGDIAGTNEAGDQPPVNKKKKKNIYLGIGSRTQWLRDVKKNGK